MDRALHIGRAAEHLVVADLLIGGHNACLTEQGMPYDVVLEHSGRLLRVQVKATLAPRNVNSHGRRERIAYSFNARQRGKGGGGRLDDTTCDLIAFVAMDTRQIAYLRVEDCGETVQIEPDGSTHETRMEQRTWARTMGGYPLESAIQGQTIERKRATHCARGHEWTPENTYLSNTGRNRKCRTCCAEDYQRKKFRCA